MKPRIIFPINNPRSSEYYSLMFEDSTNVTHYFDNDGNYDGASSDPTIDCKTGSSLN